MAIGRAELKVQLRGEDRVSGMLDSVGLKTDKMARSWGKVATSAAKARRKLSAFSAGMTDIRSMGQMVTGLVKGFFSWTDAMRKQRIEGEKAINVTRSLQLMIGDTTQVIKDATNATRGLVDATNLEVLIRKFAGLGIPLKDAVMLLDSATKLAMSAQREVPEAAEVLLGAMTGRMTTLAKQFGVAIEGVEPTAKSLAAAVDRALGGQQLEVWITKAQVYETLLANIESNVDAIVAKREISGPLGQLFRGDVGALEDLGEMMTGLDLLPGVREAQSLMADVMKDQQEATEDQIKMHGELMRFTREIRKAKYDIADKQAKAMLPAEKAITDQLRRQLLVQSGLTDAQLALRDNKQRETQLTKQLNDDATNNRQITREINVALAERLLITEQIKNEEQLLAPVLAFNAKMAKILGGAGDDDRPKAKRRPDMRPATAGEMSRSWGVQFPRASGHFIPKDAQGTGALGQIMDAPEIKLAKKIADARVRFEVERADATRAIIESERITDMAGMYDAHLAKKELIEAHRLELSQLRWAAIEEEGAQETERLASRESEMQAHAGRMQATMTGAMSALSGSGRKLDPMQDAFRATVAGMGAVVANFEDVKKGAPEAIGAIGSVVAAQIQDEQHRASFMASIVVAESIFQYIKTGRGDLLVMGLVAASLYGLSAAIPSPKKASAGGGATGAGSTPGATPITAETDTGGGFTVNFYSNAPIVTGGGQNGGAELAGLALSLAGTGMGKGAAI